MFVVECLQLKREMSFDGGWETTVSRAQYVEQ